MRSASTGSDATAIAPRHITAVLGDDGSPQSLGRGGFGAVYLARLKGRDSVVAVKSVVDLADPLALAQFRKEYSLHMQISLREGTGVCRIFGICEGHPLFHTCFVMQRYERSLLDEIQRAGSPPGRGGIAVPRVIHVATVVAQTMAVLHDVHNLIVADLKPSNVLIDARGEPVISDFGVSRVVASTMGACGGVSKSKVGGTYPFQSPEQLGAEDDDDNELRVTLQSDVWNYACTVLYALTGTRPWWDAAKEASRTHAQVFKRVAIRRRSPLEEAELPSAVPPALRALLKSCFRFEAHARPRFGGVDGIAAALEAMSDQLSPAADVYQALLDTLRFDLQEDFPKVILSYATRSDGGRGELWMWKVANALREVGITTYNGKQNVTAGKWDQKFFGKLHDATILVAFLSPEYFESHACRREIFLAASLEMPIVPLIIAAPPAGLRQGSTERYFGATPAEAAELENIEKGNLVSLSTNNFLPPPDRGVFQDDFDRNCETLVALLRAKLPGAAQTRSPRPVVGTSARRIVEGASGGGGGGASSEPPPPPRNRATAAARTGLRGARH